MTYVAGIRLQNFMRYRGTTELELEPKPYAITAEWEGEPDRSNWGGKSTLVWAIRFALTGQHPKRTEDAWITDGENDGGVDLELSDGTFVSRTRVRGKSTQLRVVYQGPFVDEEAVEIEAHGADGEEVLARLLGFTDRDAEATWWVGQSAMARLLKMQSADLSEIVSGWLTLDPLDVAHEHVLTKLRELDRERSSTTYHLGAMRAARVSPDDVESNRPVIAARVEELTALVEKLGGDSALERWRTWDIDRQAHDRVAKLVVERASRNSNPVQAPTAEALSTAIARRDELRAKLGEVELDRRTKRSLATGKFDGVCPVGGIQCPATAQLNAATAGNERLLVTAESAHSAATRAWDAAHQHVRQLEDRNKAAADRARDLADLDRRIAVDHPAAERYLAAQEPPNPADAQRAILALKDAQQALQSQDDAITRTRLADAEIARREETLVESSRQVQAYREALQILGRNGAPRRIAEQALRQIEQAANAAMVRCGIDLTVAVEWAREGKKLSTNCYGCGAVFGKSQSVKTCPECGAERGPQLDERLAITCSADSGGALDLAGAMLQCSIAHWLRVRREYSWGVVVLDEPLGQLDRYNRTAFATKLAGALRSEFAAEQAFIVAHDSSTLDAMPGRILITAGPNGSTAVVE